jgi:hypothetical protein
MKKFCHFAILAFLGWYLMVPPVSKNKVDYAAPLSQWRIVGDYNNAEACETAKHISDGIIPVQRSNLLLQRPSTIRCAVYFQP